MNASWCCCFFWFFCLFVCFYGENAINKLKLTEKCEEASENSTAILVDRVGK